MTDAHLITTLKIQPDDGHLRGNAECSCGWGRPEGEFARTYELAKNHAALWGGTLVVREEAAA